MFTIYKVNESGEDGMGLVRTTLFSTREEAEKYKGNWHTRRVYKEIVIEDYEKDTKELLKMSALSKLSEEEKEALGL
jgi:hypothetical protein